MGHPGSLTSEVWRLTSIQLTRLDQPVINSKQGQFKAA